MWNSKHIKNSPCVHTLSGLEMKQKLGRQSNSRSNNLTKGFCTGTMMMMTMRRCSRWWQKAAILVGTGSREEVGIGWMWVTWPGSERAAADGAHSLLLLLLVLSRSRHWRSPPLKLVPGICTPYLSTHQQMPRLRPRDGLHCRTEEARRGLLHFSALNINLLHINHNMNRNRNIPVNGNGMVAVFGLCMSHLNFFLFIWHVAIFWECSGSSVLFHKCKRNILELQPNWILAIFCLKPEHCAHCDKDGRCSTKGERHFEALNTGSLWN